MARTTAEIMAHADELATQFEDFEPDTTVETDALTGLNRAVIESAHATANVRAWVARAREQKRSWAEIGVVLGTSGEAARQRYGAVAVP